MEFIKKIREQMGLNIYKMSQAMGYPKPHGYTQFENSKKAVNLEKLVKLWRVSQLSADEFMLLIEKEVKGNQRKGNK